MPPRITFFVRDLAGNPVARAAPLVRALADDYDVEVVGLLLSGDEVYAPYRAALDVRPAGGRPGLLRQPGAVRRLSRLARGEVFFACKPLATTLLPALLARRARPAVPLVLDVEDDEWHETSVDPARTTFRARVARWLDPHASGARLLHPLTRRADAVTVSTRALQRRYGGVIVRHGPDETVYDPAAIRCPPAAVRRRFGLPEGRRLALFAGVPRLHKGWDVLLNALLRPEAAGWDLAVAGPAGPYHEAARARLGARFHALGLVPFEEMPTLLSAVDAAPVPQLATPFAESQLPAKALEAMAMRVPVVGTRVGDLPEILGDGERGWVVAPGDPAALAAAFAGIAADSERVARVGAAARAWFLAEASVGANRRRLQAVIATARATRAARLGRAPAGAAG